MQRCDDRSTPDLTSRLRLRLRVYIWWGRSRLKITESHGPRIALPMVTKDCSNLNGCRPTLRCPRCLEFHHEFERIRSIAIRQGLIYALTPGANLAPPNLDTEFSQWLSVHPRPTILQAWRGGWDRAFEIARGRLKGRRADTASLRERGRLAALDDWCIADGAKPTHRRRWRLGPRGVSACCAVRD
jgi:hypothetical protein